MATFFSSFRGVAHDADQYQADDPWNLGVSTSTSTTETVGQQTGNENAILYTSSPPTPEGLRSRKSIQMIRKELLGNNQYLQDRNLSNRHHANDEANFYSVENRRSLSSVRRQDGLGILPSSFQRIDGSPIRSKSSFYEQSVQQQHNLNDEDFEMNSSIEDSIFSRQSKQNFHRRQVAESPDLKRGGKAKTAVGALLVAMDKTTAEPTRITEIDQNRYNAGNNDGAHHRSILPPRAWMDNHHFENNHPIARHDEDDTIHDDYYTHNDASDYDDNQSSLHASPSSMKRNILAHSWLDEQEQLRNDTSFTRKILNDDPSSSRLEERSIVGHSPYDFNPITKEGIRSDPERKSFNTPRLLSLPKYNDELNLSAISNSHHQNDFQSINTSLADTIEEEEEYQEIPMYYQALANDVPAENIISDDDYVLAKFGNQRNDKEHLLRYTFERLQDCLDLVRELFPQDSSDNLFFLGHAKMESGVEYYRRLQALLLEIQDGASCKIQREAILFFMSILHKKSAFSNKMGGVNSEFHWVPRLGFRCSLGLYEEPQSPQTIRGGDTSLFSLPSDSANDNTPHTSNVSLATTITTVVSPDKYGSESYKQQKRSNFASSNEDHDNRQEIRKTIESLARLLYKLEEICRGLKFEGSCASKHIQNVQDIYLELLNISATNLRVIVNSFEAGFSERQNIKRAISHDQDVAESSLSPRLHSTYDNENRNITNNPIGRSKDKFRLNIEHSDNDDAIRDQSIESGKWTPTTNDMASLISPHSEDDNRAVMSNGYSELINEPVDDLRREIGSFDNDTVEDEREAPPTSDEREPEQSQTFPATFTRRFVAQRPRKSRFWKKRFLALKKRGRQVTAE